MAISLKNKICLVTGAARGIGRGIAEGFAQRGALVIATDLEPPETEGTALSMAWDVSDPKQAEDVIHRICDSFGRLDVLVANAAIYPRQPWDKVSPEAWRKTLAVDLDGVWYGAQAAAKLMQKNSYGKIITVSSIEVMSGAAEHAPYNAAKAGVIGLTRSLARSLGPEGIRVNCVMPGAVCTETELEQFPNQSELSQLMDERQSLPGRITPQDIEPTFAFFASEESDSITGQVLCVDRGWMFW